MRLFVVTAMMHFDLRSAEEADSLFRALGFHWGDLVVDVPWLGCPYGSPVWISCCVPPPESMEEFNG